MATTTRWDIKEYAVDTYDLGRLGTNDEGTGTTAILSDDSQFGAHRGADRIEVGCDVRARQDSTPGGGGTVTYDGSRIAKRPTFPAGTITLDPVLALGEVQDTDLNDTTFYVLYLPFRDEQLNKEINKVLGEDSMWQKLIRPLTAVTDGDRRSTTTTAWSETGDGAITKVAATFPLGERVLRMTGVTANDFIVSTTIAVEEKKSYYAEITGMIASTGAAADQGTWIVYDLTNAAAITIGDPTIDRFEPEILSENLSMPSGCEQIEFRLEADNAGDIIDWANVTFRKNEQMTFTLEDKPYHILDIGEVRVARSSDWGQRTFEDMYPIAHKAVQLTEGLWQLQLKGPNSAVSGHAVYYEEWVAPGELALDSSTTIAPKKAVAAVVAERLLRGVAGFEDEHTRAAIDASKVIDRAQTQRSYVTSQRVQYQARV